MKWQDGRRGGKIEDRRGMRGGKKLAFGGIGGVVVLLIAYLLGGDPGQLLNQMQGQLNDKQDATETYVSTPEEDKLFDFADVILVSTNEIWSQLFRQVGHLYPEPALAIYHEGTETGGCGYGESHFGPFYCPSDQTVYLDLSFNKELNNKYGAKGEFALAYVIAHEVGHHVQNVLGVLPQTNAMREKMSEKEYNKISVMTELQADFYAGVWAHYVNHLTDIELTYQDIVDGMQAAAAVGDDHLQEQAYGHANPESFTHGTSAQRAYWFKKGYETGDISAGDTFSDPSLK